MDTFSSQLSLALSQNHHVIDVTGAHGLAKACTALAISQQKSVIVVAQNSDQYDEWLRDLRFCFGKESNGAILTLPHLEQTPYHTTSPDPLVVMERMATLYKLATGKSFQVLLTTPEALATYTVPMSSLQELAVLIAKSSTIDRTDLIRKLKLGGFNQVLTVEDQGTFAVRGSIVDIYWPGASYPVRIDLFGDEVERLYHFDPATQRLVQNIEEFDFGPAKEIALTSQVIERAEQRLRDLADEVEYPTTKLKEKLHDIENQIPFFGIENLLPAFHSHLTTPLELLTQAYKNNWCLLLDNPEGQKQTLKDLHDHYDQSYGSALSRGDLVYEPKHFLQAPEAYDTQLRLVTQVKLLDIVAENRNSDSSAIHIRSDSTLAIRQEVLRETTRVDIAEDAQEHHILAPLAKRIRSWRTQGLTVWLPVSSHGGLHRLKELLEASSLHIQLLKEAPSLIPPLQNAGGFPPGAYAFLALPEPPSQGAVLFDSNLAIITEEEIFGKRARRQSKATKQRGFKTSLGDLNEGDFVVHVDHGLGIFKGLTRLNLRGVEQDYLLLTYAGEDKLYLPVHRINLIQPYSGVGAEPKIDKLGGTAWQSKKEKVKASVVAMAQDLLNLYAKRELIKRTAFEAPSELYWDFEAQFPFETTPDQQKAIDDVLGDLQKEKPMDRLICGDVGYGKTEVAMRGAMLTVASGKQVAVLAPTTILAQQHGITFEERFKNTGARIAVISRFQKAKEISDSLKKAKEGKIDVLIGTHRLLSSDVSFQNLGLVVVDEEQRFGIKAKEHLKRLRAHADVLTMSATPIPRTLQMSFFGIRDLSVIETPPVDRRAIRTSIVEFDDEIIREGIMRELARGGQVYFVHNRVTSIQARADYLRRLVPEAKIDVGHGQMAGDDLEDVMVRFMKHEFNVLVCTTIIETGIDVSSANTMFIDHADDFGLSQLYQLRGRIGRSKERAFAYLVIPSTTDKLTPIARKRLEILGRFSELGAGFRIAQHDLELRGAGDLLGQSQHGHIAAVGYDLYTELLKEAVEDLRGRVHEDVPDPDINLPFSSLIPDKYVVDLHERLGIYQRLATAGDTEAIWDIVGGMSELYGDPPLEVTSLAEVMILKQRLREFALRGLDATPEVNNTPPKVTVHLGDNARLNPQKLASWVKDNAVRLTLTPKMKLIYTSTDPEWRVANNSNLFALCKYVIDQLKQNAI